MTSVDGSGKTSLRAEHALETRRRIVRAGRKLFGERGYAATTLAAIAVEAGVAVQTVYATLGSKRGILRALQEAAVREPEAGALFAQAMAEPDPGRRFDLFAASIRRRWEFAHDIVRTSNEAAATETGLRAEVEQILETRRGGIRRLAGTFEGALPPGLTTDRAFAILDALSLPELYAELTGVQRWTPDEFEGWLGATLRSQLLP